MEVKKSKNPKSPTLNVNFKDDVPFFPRKDDETGTNIKLNVLSQNDHKENPHQIFYSFNLLQCKNMYLYSLGALANNLDNKTKRLLSQYLGSSSLEERSAFSKARDIGLGRYLTQTGKKIQKILTEFMKDIECFANIKFTENDVELSKFGLDSTVDAYKIAICQTEPNFLLHNVGVEGHNAFCTTKWELGYYEGAVIKIDPYLKSAPGYTNTVLHEFLHALGLGHPEYYNLEDQMRNRSILEDNGNNPNPTPLTQECMKLGTTDERKKCLLAPDELTPVDVKGLIELWGESQNKSEYCINTRNVFYQENRNYFDISESNIDHAGVSSQHEKHEL